MDGEQLNCRGCPERICLAFPGATLSTSYRSTFCFSKGPAPIFAIHMKYNALPLSFVLFLATAFLGCNKSGPSSGGAKSDDSGGTVLLKAKWPVGNRYVYRMDLDQHSTNQIPQMPKPMQQDVLMAMTYAITVLKETEGDGRELEMEFLANEMEVKMGEQVVMSFDSKETAKDDAQNPFSAPYRKMIGSKLRMQMDAQGRLEKVIGLDEWVDNVSGGGLAKQMIRQQFNEGYFRQIADFGMAFPTKPVRSGESWPFKMEVPAGPIGKIALDLKITFKGREDREQRKTVRLVSSGALKSSSAGGEAGPMGKMNIEKGKMAGTSWFDPELGALVESEGDQSMRIRGEVPNQEGGKGAPAGFTSDVAQKIKLKLVELTEAKK